MELRARSNDAKNNSGFMAYIQLSLNSRLHMNAIATDQLRTAVASCARDLH